MTTGHLMQSTAASQNIRTEYAATRAAAHAGDTVAADQHWRNYVGLLELQMGRTGSAERLTPEPKPDLAQ